MDSPPPQPAPITPFDMASYFSGQMQNQNIQTSLPSQPWYTDLLGGGADTALNVGASWLYPGGIWAGNSPTTPSPTQPQGGTTGNMNHYQNPQPGYMYDQSGYGMT